MKKILFLFLIILYISGCGEIRKNNHEIYDYSCNEDSDCVSVNEITSCYSPCDEIKMNCNLVPKCTVANKEKSNEIVCAIGKPCLKPKIIKCVDHKCVGEW